MITGMNELKTLAKHISCKCKKRFDRRKFYSNQWRNNDKYQCENRIHHLCKKDYFGILLHVIAKMEKI